jgi:hypothetical protein
MDAIRGVVQAASNARIEPISIALLEFAWAQQYIGFFRKVLMVRVSGVRCK